MQIEEQLFSFYGFSQFQDSRLCLKVFVDKYVNLGSQILATIVKRKTEVLIGISGT